METEKPARHDLITTINYYKDLGDGSAPTPVYVGKYGNVYCLCIWQLLCVLQAQPIQLQSQRGSSLSSEIFLA